MVLAASLGEPEASGLASAEPVRGDGSLLRWSRFLPATRAEGPGLRSAVWVQGCQVRCPGCFNPQLWAQRGGTSSAPAAIAQQWLVEAREAGSRGITLLGGEPFEQAQTLAVVAEAFREAGLSVMAFSGYRYEQLLEWARSREDIARLLAATDLLCDGPYLKDRPDRRRPWIGSRNQSIRALSEAHAEDVRAICTDGGTDSVEIRIGADGTVAVNGWAPDHALAELFDDLGMRADRGPVRTLAKVKEKVA